MKVTVEEAAELLRNGHVVAIPTDTVYGLAVDFKHPDALQALYSLKGRPLDKPCPVLGASLEQLRPLIAREPEGFDELAARWPGGVTIVVPAVLERVPEGVRCGFSTVGLRVPNHDLCLELLRVTGPLAVSSANRSGELPATNADAVVELLGQELPVLHSEERGSGIPSEVYVQHEDRWRQVR